ncbi:MAG: EamA family transporter [Anaerolineae bacterium CFX3]|nr:EamA family transporter [Anaerolineae bacterium]MCE7906465.1 EamA family transporter [Anaerolineae bacterium CFX3]MCQ3947857.1 EamA family transporter [Anaerolineae bacterium]RIK25712.1 MAG: EamA family transporter [Anaerolineae bacterium]
MKIKIWIALLALYIVWGSTYLAIRFAVESIPPFFHAGIRFLVSGIILLAWQRAAGQSMPTRRQWRSLAIVGSLLLLGGNGLVSWAEQTIPSGIAALIIGAIPLFIVVAEAFRPGGVKPNGWTILGLAVGFIGIFILIGPGELTGSSGLNLFGVGALLLACLFWALGSVYSKHADLPKSSLVSTGGQMLMGSAGLFIVSVVSGELTRWDVSAVTGKSMLGLVYLIFVGSLIGFVAYGWLLQNAPISLAATYAYVNPIVAALLGHWFADESLGPRVWTAAAIIVGSVIFINKSRPDGQAGAKKVEVTVGE